MVAETQRIIGLESRQERDDAIKPIAKRMNIVAQDLALEIAGAHMLTNNDDLHDALDAITAVATEAPIKANEYENTVIWTAQTPNAVPIYLAMNAIQEATGKARRLAGTILITGWD